MVASFQFFVAAHSMAQFIGFDCLKILWTEVFVYAIWHISYDKKKQDKMKNYVCLTFTL